MKKHTVASPMQLISRAAQDKNLRQELLNAITINETLFFRDAGLWHDMSNIILPQMLASKQSKKEVNVLICACSRGQEVYTLGIAAQEAEGVVPLRIIAADIDTNVLAAARQGRYSDLEVKRGLNTVRLKRHFTRKDEYWHAKQELKRNVSFVDINLASDFKFSERFDIVFCRNVLIYFTIQKRKDILDRFANFTNDDGYLILGGAETMLGVTDTWIPKRIKSSTVYQKR
jgi:chemotaxis protein methyltransferase CheR